MAQTLIPEMETLFSENPSISLVHPDRRHKQLVTPIEFLQKGGVTIVPLIFLSVVSVGIVIERLWFWSKIWLNGKQIIDKILDTASYDWTVALETVKDYRDHPIGQFFYDPLRLKQPDPELFHLALESSADNQLSLMRKGEKFLELVVALAPLLGLLGTVTGLIRSLSSIQIGDLGTASTAGVTLGIGESLISTASGLVVAIFSLFFYRLFQGFWFNQLNILRKAGNDLEIIYRQKWTEPLVSETTSVS